MRLITFDTEVIATSQVVYTRNCNGITFRNSGDVDATINGIPLPAGEKNDDFLKNEPDDVLTNQFDIKFRTPTVGVNPVISIVRRYSSLVPKEKECNYKR